MDLLLNISNSEDKDILVSLPKKLTWLEYLARFMELKNEGLQFRVIVNTVPRTAPGKKCYFIFDGFLRGYMEIYKLTETEESEICLEMNPFFVSLLNKHQMSDVEDYKYYLDNSNTQ